MPLLIRWTIAWFIGLALARWLEPPAAVLSLMAVPTVGGLLLYWSDKPKRLWASTALFGVLGAARLLSAEPTIDPSHIAYY